MKRIISIVCVFMLVFNLCIPAAWAKSSPEAGEQMKNVLADTLYGVAIGAVIGAAVSAPQDNPDWSSNIGAGVAVGAIAGLVVGLVTEGRETFSQPRAAVEIQDNEVNLSWPVLFGKSEKIEDKKTEQIWSVNMFTYNF